MTWTYHQATGQLLHDGAFAYCGYSGTGPGRNNPVAESIPNVGPIPRGLYDIVGPVEHPGLKAPVFRLVPRPETDTHGRAGFLIHGDNVNNDASHGCIILGPAARVLILNSSDRELEVVV